MDKKDRKRSNKLWRTEGCVKEVKFEDKKVTLKIEPTEAFAVGVDDAKKILFVIGEKTAAKDAELVDAKLVKDEIEFRMSGNVKLTFALLCQMKKDHVRIRVGVDEIGTSMPRIQSIALI